MKKCIVISDSFKGTLSSNEICRIARESIPKFFPRCEVVAIPIADGGEGTVDCFIEGIEAEPVTTEVRGPYGDLIVARYGRKGSTAIIEMAAAAGLPLAENRKNPELSSTYGVGEMILHAINNGCLNILLGLGGSATNDGGCGMAAALGVKFENESGESFVPVGSTLDKIMRISADAARELLKNVKITVMCDVTNPLYGPNGAAYVFAPQKGADEAMCNRLDNQLRSYSSILERELGFCADTVPGSGAAGGMGAGCMAYFGAELKPGIDAVLEMIEFDRLLKDTDLVITGEGRIDSQSFHGKVISGIAQRTKPANVPLIVIAGGIASSAADAYEAGITAMFGIDREAVSFAESAPKTAENYRLTMEDVMRLLKAADF